MSRGFCTIARESVGSSGKAFRKEFPLPSRERARVRGRCAEKSPLPHSSPLKGEEARTTGSKTRKDGSLRPNPLRNLSQCFQIIRSHAGLNATAVFVFAAALWLGQSATAIAAQSSTPGAKITGSYGGELGYQAPMWVAHDLNLFAKQGISAEIVRIAGGVRSMSALLANATQVSQSAGVSLVQANLAGGDLVMIATSTNRPTVSIVTQPKTIKKPQDLAGKTVGLEGGRGGMDEFLFLSVLERWGIDPKSITYLAISGPHSRVLAVAGGTIDVAIIAPPFTFEAEKLHLTTLADLTTSSEPFPQSGLMVRKEYLRNNRDTVKRILMAYAEAIHVLKTDADKSVAIMKKYMRIKDDAVARPSYDYFAKVFSDPPLTEPKGFAAVLRFLATQPGFAAVKNARPEEFFDNTLLLELQREGYFARLK